MRPGLLLATLALLFSPPAAAAECPPSAGIAVQVLGSGGPIADDARASSAYLVWADGAARVLVDAGSGSVLRFGQAGASFGDLDLIALSHMHTDHSADLPALLKSGYFTDRERALAVAGPTGSGPFPGLENFLSALLAPGSGAFAYLAGYLDGSDGLVRLARVEVPHEGDAAFPVLRNQRLAVSAVGVPHGIVPTVAFRVELEGISVVFASDQAGTAGHFPRFAADADLMVAHFAVPEGARGAAVRLHARPSTIGVMAAEAGARRLLLSHFMARSLADLDGGLEQLRRRYAGPVELAEDLYCTVLTAAP